MEVWGQPADTYVAGFIGSPAMNFLDATLAGGGAAATLKAGPTLPFADGRRPGADGLALTIGSVRAGVQYYQMGKADDDISVASLTGGQLVVGISVAGAIVSGPLSPK